MTKPGNSGSEEPTQAEASDATDSEATDQAAETSAEPDSPAEPDEEEATAEPAKENLADKKAAEAKAAEAAEKKARRSPRAADIEKAPPPPQEEALRAQAKRRFEEPAPRTLRFSFYFFTAAGAIWLLSMIASLIYKQDIINNEIKRNQDPKITPEQITSAVNQILWIVTIAALAFTIFLALFGYKATEGTRRARTLVTIFAIVLVLFHLLLNGTQLGILSAMFALVGLALLWSPSARKYFPPRQVP